MIGKKHNPLKQARKELESKFWREAARQAFMRGVAKRLSKNKSKSTKHDGA